MKLYEYLAKEVLAARGIPVPRGRLARTPEEAARAARDLGGPVMVKAQVLAGGRGKAGGIRPAATPEEAEALAAAILGMTIGGLPVQAVYVEERLTVDRELYLAITVDTGARRPVLLAAGTGGVDIEELPEREIVRRLLPVPWGLQPHAAREVARLVGLAGAPAVRFEEVALRLYEIFRATDAELVEINPLALCGERLVAADARLNVDDDARYRHPELPRVEEPEPPQGAALRELGLAFVPLEGEVAVMANGAGMAMATLDALAHLGARPLNFLDVGGGAAAGPMARALEVLAAMRPRAILVNIFGGITRCDEVARAILAARERAGAGVPLVVRLVGTNEEEGLRLLAGAGIAAHRSMEEAVRAAAALARGEGP